MHPLSTVVFQCIGYILRYISFEMPVSLYLENYVKLNVICSAIFDVIELSGPP
jgi:hypothetical protein